MYVVHFRNKFISQHCQVELQTYFNRYIFGVFHILMYTLLSGLILRKISFIDAFS